MEETDMMIVRVVKAIVQTELLTMKEEGQYLTSVTIADHPLTIGKELKVKKVTQMIGIDQVMTNGEVLQSPARSQ
jgi:hypothetical protein